MTTATYRVVLWLDPFGDRGGPLALGAYCWEAREDAPMVWVPREWTGNGVSITEEDERFLRFYSSRLATAFRDSARWGPSKISGNLDWGRSGRIPPTPGKGDIPPEEWARWLEGHVYSRPMGWTGMVSIMPLDASDWGEILGEESENE